ncbi:DUF2752 domain-containing protein [Cellulomonas sp. McL0617]|uniref:DUF2752 domain-containing protein n=1 Tax=Cellulomonas sp. McL0617 TaxID=3415675 RepID=UPI003CED8A9B
MDGGVADEATRTSTSAPLARRLAGPAAVVLAAGVGLATLALVDPNQAGHYPTCPFFWLTGLYCPGCGSLRALHDLTRLDVAAAWGMNPLLVVALPFLVASWIAWTRRSVTGAHRRLAHPAWIWAVLALVLAFWVARNIPALAPWLAP